jgi:hypothetical protein
MNDQPKKNTEDEQSKDTYEQDNGSGGDSFNDGNPEEGSDDIDDTDKYLALEQPGVSYTPENDPTVNSDQSDFGNPKGQEWNEEGGNSRNSDAFNQDDYILNDNVDVDEDQNQSISTDDEDFEENNERYD